MKLKYGVSPAVCIDLKAGIYLLPEEFEVEKSYMCKLFHDIASIKRVISHTFPSEMNASYILDSASRDVVMLARYDMHPDDYTCAIQEFAKKGIVLLDCMSHDYPRGSRRCLIDVSEDKIYVFNPL